MSAPIDGERGEPTLVVWERARGEVFELEYGRRRDLRRGRPGHGGVGFVVGGIDGRRRGHVPPRPRPGLPAAAARHGVPPRERRGRRRSGESRCSAQPEAGKSTTAAAFAKLGYPVLSDDLLALSDTGGTWVVEAGYPGLRLWPDSVGPLLAHDDPVDLAAFCGRILDDFHTLTPSGASVARRLDG